MGRGEFGSINKLLVEDFMQRMVRERLILKLQSHGGKG